MKILIGYSLQERALALMLKHSIEFAGHEVWLDPFESRPPERATAELGAAGPQVVLVLLSPAAVSATWLSGRFAQSGEPVREMIPIVVRACAIPTIFADRPALDVSRDSDHGTTANRIGRLLEGDRSATMVLDTNKLTELSDRALREDAEEAFPSLAQEIEAVLDEPIRALTLEVDQDGWPRAGSGALELVMDMGASGSARLLLAAYVEGATWKASFDLEERPPSAFFGSEKPRVDARFIWGSRHLPLRCGRDASDLGEQPLTLQLELDEFALPSLRRLMAQRSAISLWDHSGAEPVELSATRIDMRLIATVRSVTLLGGVCVWRSRHEREESVLLGCTPVATFETQIQREIWLGAHRRNGLRQAATTQDRRRRLVEAICSGAPVAAADHWTAFHLLVGRARSAKLRRSNAEARASYVRALDYGLALCHSDEPGYVNAMKLWDTAMALVALLRESGDEAAQRRYATAAVEFARSLMRREPAEADYARALSQALLARAELAASSVEVVGDLEEAASLMFELADSRDDLPWRRTDAQQAAERAAALWPKELVCPNAWRSRHPERQIGR